MSDQERRELIIEAIASTEAQLRNRRARAGARARAGCGGAVEARSGRASHANRTADRGAASCFAARPRMIARTRWVETQRGGSATDCGSFVSWVCHRLRLIRFLHSRPQATCNPASDCGALGSARSVGRHPRATACRQRRGRRCTAPWGRSVLDGSDGAPANPPARLGSLRPRWKRRRSCQSASARSYSVQASGGILS